MGSCPSSAVNESEHAASVAVSTDSASPAMIHTSPPWGTSAMHESEPSSKFAPPMNRTCSSPAWRPKPSGCVSANRVNHSLSRGAEPRMPR